MSQADVEIVRSMYDAYLAGDVERALALCHPDVRADFSVRGDAGVSTGREALNAAVAEWIGAWDDYGEQLEEIRDLGGAVCVIAIQRGRGKGSGLAIENRFASLYEVEGGLITSVRMFDGPEAAVAAARDTG